MKSYWDLNIEVLQEKDPKLYQIVMEHSPNDIGEVLSTDTVPTLRFKAPGQDIYAYDPENPLGEIEKNLHDLENKKNLAETICIFTGMGFGYSPLTLLAHRKDIFRMLVLEPNLDIFYLALQHVDLRPLFLSDKVFILVGDIDWDEFYRIVTQKSAEIGFLFNDYKPLFGWKPGLYNETKEKARALAMKAFIGHSVMTQFGTKIFQNRMDNLSLLRNASSVDVLKGAFKNKPAILVSAGPSLGKSMKMLKDAVGKSVIIAVDSAVVPLLDHGIKPDFVTTLDFQDINSEKFSPDILSQSDFYLVANISSSPLTPKRLGLNHLFFSFQDNDSQGWILKALEIKHQMPASSSVATLSLGFAHVIEADPVIFVGYDFALTSTEIDHVEGAVLSDGYYLTQKNRSGVKGIDGKGIATTNSFLSVKLSLEQQMEGCRRTYINATATGAHIEGSTVMDLGAVIQNHLTSTISPVEVVNDCLKNDRKIDIHGFIETAHSTLVEVKTSLKHVKKILTQTVKINGLLKNKKQKKLRKKNFSDLPLKVQSKIQKRNGLHSSYSPFLPMEELAAKKISELNTSYAMNEGSYNIDQISKENSAIVAQMKAHQYGLQSFIEFVENLILFLEKEGTLLDKIGQKDKEEKSLIELAKLYLSADCFSGAGKTLNKFMALFPDSPIIPEAQMLMGKTAAQLYDFNIALDLWEKAERKNPCLHDEIKEFGQRLIEDWLISDQQTVLVEKKISRGLDLLGDKPSFWNLIGDCFRKATADLLNRPALNRKITIEGEFVDNIEIFLNAWSIVADKVPEWSYLMAKLLFQKNQASQSVEYIVKALEFKPENPEWLALLAKLYLETGNHDKGIEQLLKAVQLDSTQAILWEELGDSLFDVQDYASAIIAYENCFVALPENYDVLRKFGDCYLKNNQPEAAKTAYQAVLQKDSGNEIAKQNLKLIESGGE